MHEDEVLAARTLDFLGQPRDLFRNPEGCQKVAGGRSNAQTSGQRLNKSRTPEEVQESFCPFHEPEHEEEREDHPRRVARRRRLREELIHDGVHGVVGAPVRAACPDGARPAKGGGL